MEPAVHRLLAVRAPGKTICPSEVARDIAGAAADWRASMPAVHAAIDAMAARGDIVLSWRGKPLPERAGPYRIGRPA